MSCVEHVIGEEKYECEMLNVVVRESRILVGRVSCDVCRGVLFEFWVCIFYITILFQFRMIVEVGLTHVCCIWLRYIVAIAILVWWLE